MPIARRNEQLRPRKQPVQARSQRTVEVVLKAAAQVFARRGYAGATTNHIAERAGEMAIRLSIGAGRGQLVRQLLGESCLLAVFGGLGGLVVAQWTLNLMAARTVTGKIVLTVGT